MIVSQHVDNIYDMNPPAYVYVYSLHKAVTIIHSIKTVNCNVYVGRA